MPFCWARDHLAPHRRAAEVHRIWPLTSQAWEGAQKLGRGKDIFAYSIVMFAILTIVSYQYKSLWNIHHYKYKLEWRDEQERNLSIQYSWWTNKRMFDWKELGSVMEMRMSNFYFDYLIGRSLIFNLISKKIKISQSPKIQSRLSLSIPTPFWFQLQLQSWLYLGIWPFRFSC